MSRFTRRLLTTHAVTGLAEACRIMELYRMRWTIEEYFHTLKTAGFEIEEADISEPPVMTKFVTAAPIAGVTVMQLVKARDGTTGQTLAEASNPTINPFSKPFDAAGGQNCPPEKSPSQRFPRLCSLDHCWPRGMERAIMASPGLTLCDAAWTTFGASSSVPH